MVRNDLDAVFARARAEGRGVLIPYVTGGFPDPATYVDLAASILDAGGDLLEIGIPFSDPLLDGPAIQRSQQGALDAGVSPRDCLRFAADIHRRTDAPLLLMGAFNPVFAYGLDTFCAEAASAGVSALILPDLPFEEQGDLRTAAEGNGLHVIQMVAPTSTDERLARVCRAASGFIYCVSVAGVTGARSSVAATARPLVERVRRYTDVPVAVGFGIGGPEQAREVATFADGAAVGSALINLLAEAPAAERVTRAREFIGRLRDALTTRPVAG